MEKKYFINLIQIKVKVFQQSLNITKPVFNFFLIQKLPIKGGKLVSLLLLNLERILNRAK